MNDQSSMQTNGKTVSLCLGSGGARGYTHIGVIDEVLARGYDITSISGCSMGAIVGGFYAAGRLEAFREWVTDLTYLKVLKLVDFSLVSNGAIRGDRIFNTLDDMLDGVQIEDLQLPFTAVATDLTHKKELWFQKGSLNKAIRASAAIPSLLTPVISNGRMLVDGGVLNPLPIAPCVSAHADFIMAVDLNADIPMPADFAPEPQPSPEQKSDWFDGVVNTALDKAGQILDHFDNKPATSKEALAPSEDAPVKQSAPHLAQENLGKLEILNQMFEVMQASLSGFKTAGYQPDLLMRVPATCCEFYEFYRADEMIRLGRHIASEALDAFEQKGASSLYGLGQRP
ncbi:patatin-like phospholipase family protein [Bacterioplanoides sp.]|uniref:patatin-like phospholipase family protein n=1 Tax=Bacterioplanoides sp. TaxID=2066072 RepID=UPI003B00424D